MNIPPATRSIGPLDRQSDPRAPRLALTLARLIERGGRLSAIEDVYATVAEELATLVTFERLSISVFDADAAVTRIDYNATTLPDIPPAGSRYPFSDSVAGQVFRTRRPLIHTVGSSDFPDDAIRQANGIKEVAVAPIVVDESTYGAIAISSIDAGRYTPADLWILTTLANLLGMMVSGVTLRQEAQAKRQGAELLARVARQLAGLRETAAICAALVELLAQVLGKTTIVFLATHDGRFTVGAVRAADPELTARATSIATSLCELPRSRIERLRARIGANQPLVIRASESSPDVADELYRFADYGIGELVVMPLFAADDLIGTITVMELTVDDTGQLAHPPMTSEQCALLSAVAEQAAPSLMNARLHESLQWAYHESETLRRIGQELARSHNTRQALDLACRAVFALFNADYTGIVRLMPDGSMHWEAVVGNRTGRHARGPISPSLIDPIRDGRVLVIQDFPHDIATTVDDYPVTVAEGIRSSLVVPIMVAGESVGGLAIAFRSRRPIAEGDIRMGQALAQTLASAVQAITGALVVASEKRSGAGFGPRVAHVGHDADNRRDDADHHHPLPERDLPRAAVGKGGADAVDDEADAGDDEPDGRQNGTDLLHGRFTSRGVALRFAFRPPASSRRTVDHPTHDAPAKLPDSSAAVERRLQRDAASMPARVLAADVNGARRHAGEPRCPARLAPDHGSRYLGDTTVSRPTV